MYCLTAQVCSVLLKIVPRVHATKVYRHYRHTSPPGMDMRRKATGAHELTAVSKRPAHHVTPDWVAVERFTSTHLMTRTHICDTHTHMYIDVCVGACIDKYMHIYIYVIYTYAAIVRTLYI